MAGETVEYRPPRSTDADGILAVLEEVAPEIPLPLTAKAREIIRARVVQCCSSQQSCVAVDPADRVVGFLLAEPDKKERLHHDNQALHLPYAGVTKSGRRQGVFHKLLEEVMSRQVVLTATVKCANRCGMAARLMKIGFTKISSNGQDDQFWWQPGR
jgi:ribosomal protein S18 acetylase RimI-like enzyme